METLKKWGKWIIAGLIFVGSLLFALRGKSGGAEKQSDSIPSDVINKQQEEKLQENKASIEASQNAAVQAAKPVAKSDSQDIDAAINKWNNS